MTLGTDPVTSSALDLPRLPGGTDTPSMGPGEPSDSLSSSLLRSAARLCDVVVDVGGGDGRFTWNAAQDNPSLSVVTTGASTGAVTAIPAGSRLLMRLGWAEGTEADLADLSALVDGCAEVRLFIQAAAPAGSEREHPTSEQAGVSALHDWLHGHGFRVFRIDDHAGRWAVVPPPREGDEPAVSAPGTSLLCVRGAEVHAVAAVLHSGQLRGAERTHLAWARAMQARGHLVHTFLGVGDELPAALRAAGQASSAHGMGWWVGSSPGRSATDGVPDLIEDLRAMGPDVVVTQTAVIPGGALAARVLGIPHLWYVHEFLDLDHGMTLPAAPREVGRAIEALSDVVVANSAAVHAHLFGGRPPVIAVPLSDEDLEPIARAQRPDPPDGIPVVGILGTAERKGHLDLVRAVALLRDAGRPVSVVAFGSRYEASFLRRLTDEIDALGVADLVSFVKEVDGPQEALDAVDLVVVPSWCEAFGRVPVEAITAGVPVVYADSGGLSEYMRDGVTGVAARPQDPASLAEAILRVLDDADLRAGLREGALPELRRTFAGHLAADVLAEQIRQVRLTTAGSWAQRVVTDMVSTVAEDVSRVVVLERGRLSSTIDDLTETVRQREDSIARLTQVVVDHEGALAEARSQLASTASEISVLEGALAQAGSEQRRLEGEVAALRSADVTVSDNLVRAQSQATWALSALDAACTLAEQTESSGVRRLVNSAARPASRLRRRPARQPLSMEVIRLSGLFEAEEYLAAYPDVRMSGMDAWEHYSRFGNEEGRRPNPLFDPGWYVSQHGREAMVHPDPVRDHLEAGAYQGRDPHPLVDSWWYLTANPDVRDAGANPLGHYLTAGATEGRTPHPLFDPAWYLRQGATDGRAPLVHYVTQGWREGRQPHPLFDVGHYLEQAPEARASGQSPLVHYLTVGSGRGLRPNPHFDPAWYRAQYGPVIPPGMDPLGHYWLYGWRENFQPSAQWPAADLAAGGPVGRPDVCPLLPVLHPGVDHPVAAPAVAVTGATRERLAGRGRAELGEARRKVRSLRWRVGSRVRRFTGQIATGGDVAAPVVPPTDSAPLSRDLAERAGAPAGRPPAARPVRVVAFYLPQFHPIPENDAWWGEGFTEWTNVRRGRPLYEGHHQPHVPGDLGYYDLMATPLTMPRQVQMARQHGVDAFCFYVYWFAGHRLLEGPVERFLADPSLDIQFCVCWANENWTRTWDGDERTGLMVQQHSAEDDIAFIDAMAPALLDPRAIRVGGRPLLLVYRPGLLPDPVATAQRWRARCREQGIGEIALAYVRGFETPLPEHIGFDFSVEFPPANSGIPDLTGTFPVDPPFVGKVYDLGAVAARESLLPAEPGLWRGVCPSWDNTARRPDSGGIMVGSTPELFRSWLVRAGSDTIRRFADPSERLVWVNAWNEWAEGAHLEPDAEFGYQWLHAVRDAQEALAGVATGTGPGVVVVAHDLHRHGAQMLSLAMATWLARTGLRVEVVALGPGAMRPEFEDVATVHHVDDGDADRCAAVAADLARRGFVAALANSAVTGRFARHLHDAGVHVTGLVHELPEILAQEGRGVRAEVMAGHVDRLVFPSELVRDRFPYRIADAVEVVVAPQGVYASLPPLGGEASRRALRERLRLPDAARIVLGAGYGDHRKGMDLFCRTIADLVADEGPDPVYGVWIGVVATSDPAVARAIDEAPQERLLLPGFVADPEAFHAGADVLALTSREDPFPSVALEAMAAGVPVVAFRGATGLGQLLADGGGMVASPFDVPAFAALCRTAWQAGDPQHARTRRDLVLERHNFHRYMLDLLAATPAGLPRVSVVIPNYQYAPLLADRIRQVAAQTVPPYELIVLDDASKDDSVAVAERALAGLSIPHRLVVNDVNSGVPSRQWARGARMAHGDLVWIAEADDVADPRFLEEVLAGFGVPGVVMSYCQSRQVDRDGRLMAPDYGAYTAELGRDFTRRYVEEGPDEVSTCLAVKNSIPNVSAVVFDRRALVGAFDACGGEVSQLRYAGDWMLYAQVLQAGRIAFSPRALNDHRRHAGSVIGAGDAAEHVRQIRRVQQFAAGLPGVVVDPDAQREWVRAARVALGVPGDHADV